MHYRQKFGGNPSDIVDTILDGRMHKRMTW